MKEFGHAADVAAGARDVEIVLGRGKAIAGIVRDKDGRPARGNVTLALLGVKGALWFSSSDEHGRFRVAGLPPGTYSVRATNASVLTMGPGGTKVEAGNEGLELTQR